MKYGHSWKMKRHIINSYNVDMILSYTYLGAKKRVDLKSGPRMGRKIDKWVTWIYPIIQEDFDIMRSAGVKFLVPKSCCRWLRMPFSPSLIRWCWNYHGSELRRSLVGWLGGLPCPSSFSRMWCVPRVCYHTAKKGLISGPLIFWQSIIRAKSFILWS